MSQHTPGPIKCPQCGFVCWFSPDRPGPCNCKELKRLMPSPYDPRDYMERAPAWSCALLAKVEGQR